MCINLTQEVTVEASNPDKVTINVTLTDFETITFFQPPLTINVNVNSCLPGTYLSQQSQVCVCDDNILSFTTDCNGITATVTKEGTSWLGDENCTAINDECPYDYCIHSSITFLLSDPDRQCALNRSGLLCGKCKKSYVRL